MFVKWWRRSLARVTSICRRARLQVKNLHHALGKPWLEVLEDRTVLATSFAVGAGAGSLPQVNLMGSPDRNGPVSWPMRRPTWGGSTSHSVT